MRIRQMALQKSWFTWVCMDTDGQEGTGAEESGDGEGRQGGWRFKKEPTQARASEDSVLVGPES